MSCQICVEVCPFDAIKMDKVYELSKRERFNDLLMRKEQLSKSNEYYHGIHPTEATEVDTRLAEAAAAKKKPAAPATPAPPAAATAARAATSPVAAAAVEKGPAAVPAPPPITSEPSASDKPAPPSGA